MLLITVPEEQSEQLNEETNEFIYTPINKAVTLQLEHSLISISKWESKWHIPFFSKKDKSLDELIDYIKCMTLNKNIESDVYERLLKYPDLINQISDYMNDPMTATTFRKNSREKNNNEIVTSELIYYWMIVQNIPVEFERWHIKRLLTLIRVCNVKNAPAKKTNQKELLRRNAAINAANRKKYHTKG